MTKRTKNQNDTNKELSALINSNPNIRWFAVFSINLLQNAISDLNTEQKIKYEKFITVSNKTEDVLWFFVKGGTALKLYRDKKFSLESKLHENNSDWDTQIVINPKLPFKQWYQVRDRVEEVINHVLVISNVALTFMPDIKDYLKKQLPQKCEDNLKILGKPNANDKEKLQLGGRITHVDGRDQKRAYLYDRFHPSQSSDTVSHYFAVTPNIKEVLRGTKPAADMPNELDMLNNFFEKMADNNVKEKGNEEDEKEEKYHEEPNDKNETHSDDRTAGAFKVASTVINKQSYTSRELAAKVYRMLMSFGNKHGWGTDQQKSSFKSALKKTGKSKDLLQMIDELLDTLGSDREARAPLASCRHNLNVGNYYLYRLLVNYKFNKPEKHKDYGAEHDYQKAWGNNKVRAEIIDVTIPRRDTQECLHQAAVLSGEHWQLTQINVDDLSGVSIPVLGKSYHLDEQIVLLRESIAGTTHSANKFAKRLRRCAKLVALNDRDTFDKKSVKNGGKFLIDHILNQFTNTYNAPKTKILKTLERATIDLNDWWKKGNNKKVNVRMSRATNKYTQNLTKCGVGKLGYVPISSMLREEISEPVEFNLSEEGSEEAAMQNCLYIVVAFADLADEIKEDLKQTSAMLGADKASSKTTSDYRLLIKSAYQHINTIKLRDINLVFQLSGDAATYCHIKDVIYPENVTPQHSLEEILFVNPVTANLFIVSDKEVDVERTVEQISSRLMSVEKDYDIKVEKNLVYLRRQSFQDGVQLIIDVAEKSADEIKKDDATEYASGLPVVNLRRLIETMEPVSHAQEFFMNSALEATLQITRDTFAIRSYLARYLGMPLAAPLALSPDKGKKTKSRVEKDGSNLDELQTPSFDE